MMWGNGMGWGAWLLMALTAAGFWALVALGVVALFRGAAASGTGPSPTDRATDDRARQILDERFARGEIDVDEYRTRLTLLPPRR